MILNPRRAEDPTVAITLIVIATLTVAGLVAGPLLLKTPDKDVWDLVIKVAGASVVLIGSYFAARTLKQSRADQRDSRILAAIGLVGNERPEVRVGALLVLGELAKSTGDAQRDDYLAAIRETVETVAGSDVPQGTSDAPKRVAASVLGRLPAR